LSIPEFCFKFEEKPITMTNNKYIGLIRIAFIAMLTLMFTCSCTPEESECEAWNRMIDEEIQMEMDKCNGRDKCTPDQKKIYKLNQQRCEG
jgi:hypothetical protein